MTDGSMTQPPRWAEQLLRVMLEPKDRESVLGDLLEEYREVIVPERGPDAPAWYVGQVAGFAWRTSRTWAWGVLFAASWVGRDMLDWWLSPTADYYARSVVSTAMAAGLFVCAGSWNAWRSRSIRAGMLAGLATGLIGAGLITVVSLGQLAVVHDPHTMRMIEASGGLDEVFLLPLMVTIPGTVCATAGAVVGKGLPRLTRSETAQ